MKLIIILLVCIIAGAELYDLPKDDYSPDKLKNDDVELKNRVDCLLDKQPCTPLTALYRQLAEEGITTACLKCTPEQKALAKAFLEGLKIKYPEEYKELVLKYDPTGHIFPAFEKAIGLMYDMTSFLRAAGSGILPLHV